MELLRTFGKGSGLPVLFTRLARKFSHRLPRQSVANTTNLQPVVAAIAAIAIGQDTFTWDKPIAAALVIAGAYVVTQGSSKRCKSS